MSPKRLIAASVLSCLIAGPAFAQTTDTQDPAAPMTPAANGRATTATGATVPRPGAIDASKNANAGRSGQGPSAADKNSDKLMSGICIGCSAK